MTLFGGDVLGTIVKHVIKRDRPAQHPVSDTGYSFPSGHVLGFFLIAAIISLVVVPLIRSGATRVIIQLVLIFAVVLVAISRVYLQAHYPSDTFGAMLLAYAWLQFSEGVYVWYAPRLRRWKMTHIAGAITLGFGLGDLINTALYGRHRKEARPFSQLKGWKKRD